MGGKKSVRITRNLTVAVLFGALSISAYAQQRRGEIVLVRPPASPVRLAGSWVPPGSANLATSVVGSVIDIRQIPVGNVRVQLRDLGSGAVVGERDTNGNGEYEFMPLDPGTYVVELIEARSVIALSNAGAISRYQTLRTVIKLPGRWNASTRTVMMPVPPTSFFGLGSINSLTSSTLTLASTLEIRPVDAGEPVSPQ